MGKYDQVKEALKNYSKSGPTSSDISTPKQNPVREDIKQCFDKVNKIEDKICTIQDTVDMNSGLVESLKDLNNTIKQELDIIKKRLGLGIGSVENPVTMRSSDVTLELYNLAATLHIHDVNPLIKVDQETWGTEQSHFKALDPIFGVLPGQNYIEDLVELPAMEVDGKIQYPVNVKYTNPLNRALGVKNFRALCEKKKLSYPMQYSTINHPELKYNMSAMSSILKDLQSEGKIEWYCMNNFMAVNHMEFIAPMYTIRVNNMDKPSEYKDCYTNSLYHSGFSIPNDDKDNNYNSYITMRDAIAQQVKDLTAKHKPSYANVVQQSASKPLVTDREVETETALNVEVTNGKRWQEETTEPQCNVTDKIEMARDNLKAIKKNKAKSNASLRNQSKQQKYTYTQHTANYRKYNGTYNSGKTTLHHRASERIPLTPKVSVLTPDFSSPPPPIHSLPHANTRGAPTYGTQRSPYQGTWHRQASPPILRGWALGSPPYQGGWSQGILYPQPPMGQQWLSPNYSRGMTPPYAGNLDYLMRIGASMLR